MFDQSTDRSNSEKACIVVIYPDFEMRKIVTTILEVANVRNEYDNNHQADSGVLYNYIVNSFAAYNISMQNAGSFGSDGCSTMIGAIIA